MIFYYYFSSKLKRSKKTPVASVAEQLLEASATSDLILAVLDLTSARADSVPD